MQQQWTPSKSSRLPAIDRIQAHQRLGQGHGDAALSFPQALSNFNQTNASSAEARGKQKVRQQAQAKGVLPETLPIMVAAVTGVRKAMDQTKDIQFPITD